MENLDVYEYKTSDLALAAAISLFTPLIRLERVGNRVVTFVFPNSDKVEGLIASYWDRSLNVSSWEYAHQMKALKTRVKEELRNA